MRREGTYTINILLNAAHVLSEPFSVSDNPASGSRPATGTNEDERWQGNLGAWMYTGEGGRCAPLRPPGGKGGAGATETDPYWADKMELALLS